MNPRVRRGLLVVVSLFLLWVTWTGVTQGIRQLPESRTPGQTAQSISQIGFGLFALLSFVTTFWSRRWNTLMLCGWIVSVTLAGGLASIVWGGTSLAAGLVAGLVTLVVALAVAWLLRVGAGPRALPR